jgi:hypothetical protein
MDGRAMEDEVDAVCGSMRAERSVAALTDVIG